MLYGGYQPKFRPSKQCYILHFFLPGCELVFKTLSTDRRDYHSEMNSVIFNKWVEEQLVPALPPKSLVVMEMLYVGYQPKFRPSKQCYILDFFFV
jgi:hypothetical protein